MEAGKTTVWQRRDLSPSQERMAGRTMADETTGHTDHSVDDLDHSVSRGQANYQTWQKRGKKQRTVLMSWRRACAVS